MRHTQSVGAPVPGSYGTQAFTGASAEFTTGSYRIIRIKTDQGAHVRSGGGTATTTDPLIESDDGWLDFKNTPGQKIAVIQATTGGTLQYYGLS